MSSTRCLRCGRVNSEGSATCHGCGEKLLQGEEYESRLQELRDYEDLRRRYSLLSILLVIVLLVLLCPAASWFIGIMLPVSKAGSIDAVTVRYAAPATILLIFLLLVPRMVYSRWKIKRRYGWTRERIQSLDSEVGALPKDFFTATTEASDASDNVARKMQGPPVVLLVIVFVLVGLAFLARSTGFRWESITSLSGCASTAVVEGEYECRVEAADLGGGVRRSEQTWSYVFRSDGTYTSYLEGSQQYSGTWSQSGTILTVDVPAIAGLSAAYSFKATVSRDASSFAAGDRKFVKVR